MKQLKITNKSLLVIVVIAAIIVLGILAAVTVMQPKGPQTTVAGDNATKLAFYNNHMAASRCCF